MKVLVLVSVVLCLLVTVSSAPSDDLKPTDSHPNGFECVCVTSDKCGIPADVKLAENIKKETANRCGPTDTCCPKANIKDENVNQFIPEHFKL